MLALLDRYEMRIELKGGHRQFLAKLIIITSNQHPQGLYGHESILQLLRRINKIKHIT